MKDGSEERIGNINYNRLGSEMIIVEYKSATDIWVKFTNHGNLAHTTWLAFCRGAVKDVYDKTVWGVGYLGEGVYKTRKDSKANQQYKSWQSMLQRCYDVNYHKGKPTYQDCTVTPEWHNFQNFAQWYDENYYEIEGEKMALDKDILVKGNKVYSPDTCIFVPQKINGLFTRCNASRGKTPIGVQFRKDNKKYNATCNNGNGNRLILGMYNSPEEAFLVYKEHKEKIIKKVAEEYENKIPEKLFMALISYIVEIND